jgi:hypothetical protein
VEGDPGRRAARVEEQVERRRVRLEGEDGGLPVGAVAEGVVESGVGCIWEVSPKFLSEENEMLGCVLGERGGGVPCWGVFFPC